MGGKQKPTTFHKLSHKGPGITGEGVSFTFRIKNQYNTILLHSNIGS